MGREGVGGCVVWVCSVGAGRCVRGGCRLPPPRVLAHPSTHLPAASPCPHPLPAVLKKDPYSMHAGCPVAQGVKYSATKWVSRGKEDLPW